jgi:hypothetical protein
MLYKVVVNLDQSIDDVGCVQGYCYWFVFSWHDGDSVALPASSSQLPPAVEAPIEQDKPGYCLSRATISRLRFVKCFHALQVIRPRKRVTHIPM